MSKGARLKRLQTVRERLHRLEQTTLGSLLAELRQVEERRVALLQALGDEDRSAGAAVALLLLDPARMGREVQRLETAVSGQRAAVQREQSLASRLGRLADAQLAIEERERAQREEAEMLDRIMVARLRSQV